MRYSFKELIDVTKLQELTDELYLAASIPSAIVSMDGEVLTGSGWQRICTDFHRQHPESKKDCFVSDIKIRKQLVKGEPFAIYKCPRGLVDASSPVIIAGEHIANIFAGQLFLQPPDEATEQFFREQARKFGFDETEYIRAFKEIPIFTEKKFRSAITFLAKLAQMIADMGLTRLNELKSIEALRKNEKELSIKNRIAKAFLAIPNDNMYGEVLNVVLDAMESPYGTFAYINEDGDRIVPSMTRDIWDECKMPDKGNFFPRETWGDSLWGRCLVEQKSFSSNGPFSVPEGHISLARALATPIIYKGESIGNFMVGDKPTNYTEQDVISLEAIADHIAPILASKLLNEQYEIKRKQAEDKVLKNQYYLTKAQEIGKIGTWELDIQKNILKWTDENYKIFGVPLGTELNYEIFLNSIHPDDKDYVQKKWCAALNNEPYDIMHRLIISDKVKWVREKADIEFDTAGKPVIAIGFTQDLTDLRQIEDALKESEQKFKMMFEQAPLSYQSLDENGNFTIVNQTWLQTMGYTREEVLGKNFSEFLHPDWKDHFKENFPRFKAIGEILGVEFEMVKKDGSLILVSFHGKIGKDKYGNFQQTHCILQDITERTKTFEAFKEQKEFSEKIIKTSNAIIIGLDKNHKIKIFNRGAEKITGFKNKEVIGRDWFKIFFKPDIYDEMDKVWKSAWGAKSNYYVNPIQTKNGDERIISWQTTGMYDSADETKHMLLSIGEDITTRMQAKKALQISEERLDLSIKGAGIGLWDWNIQTGETVFNERWAEIVGYNLEELSPVSINTWIDLCHPDDLEKSNELLEEHFAGKTDYYLCEARMKHKDGHWVWVLDQGRIFEWNKEGKPLRATGTHIDITGRKIAEKKIQASEEKYRSIMESMDDAIYICSSDFRIEYMNPAMINRTGYDAAGESCHKVIHGLDEKCSWCVFEKVIRGNSISNEVVSPKDNKTFHISNSPIFHTDGSVSKLTVFRDITEFKKMEINLQQAQKMESIGTLAGGIAHDFNNILFPIVGHTEMLLEDIPEDSPFHTSLNHIYTGAMRARDLVKQILTFSRQGSSELKLMKMQPIIKEALKLIRSTIPTTIDIKQNIDPECGIIKADPTQIHQIVMNLATNAYHAMEETGGVLKLNLKEIKLDELDLINPDMSPGTYACLIVADTGTGMDKNLTDKIFDPFFTTKKSGKGTGMGLSVVHGIVKSMGGAIQVNSEPDEGTKFYVYLPVEKSLSEKQAIPSKAGIKGGTEQILLVDDEDVIVTMEKLMLERLGYQVTSRTSSLEALEVFRDSPDRFNLVITDMAMPNMSGDKLAVELTKIHPDIPILLCTGFSETMSEEKAASLGIRGFLLKPITMKDLSQKIREVLDDQ